MLELWAAQTEPVPGRGSCPSIGQRSSSPARSRSGTRTPGSCWTSWPRSTADTTPTSTAIRCPVFAERAGSTEKVARY